MPSDEIAGIIVHQEGRRGHRVFPTNGPDWSEQGLPRIATVREFIAHAEKIVALMKSRPPAADASTGDYDDKYDRYLRLRFPEAAER